MIGRGNAGLRFGCAVTAILQLFASTMWAVPREMSNEELDEVCAKGSSGPSLDMTLVQQVFFQFHQYNNTVRVDGFGGVSVAAADPSRVQVQVGSPWLPTSPTSPTPPTPPSIIVTMPPVSTSSGQGATGLSGSLGAVGTIGTIGIQPIQVKAVDTSVQITCDFNLSIQTLPGILQIVQENHLLLPSSLFQQITSPRLGTGNGRGIGLGH